MKVLWSFIWLVLAAGFVSGCPDEIDPVSDTGVPQADVRLTLPDASADVVVLDTSGHDLRGMDAAAGQDLATDPLNPNNHNLDTDCDGLSDAEEYANVYAGGGQTDPSVADSDGDGLLDGVELGRTSSVADCPDFVGDADSASKTDPTRADSDLDGLVDGVEDADHNGSREVTETDPQHPDSDRDGRCDGAESVPPICVGGDTDPLVPNVGDADADGVPDNVDSAPDDPDRDGDGLCDGAGTVSGVCTGGEDLNGNGVIDSGETDPDHLDTDCDGIADGEERDLSLNPLKPDSDGDLVVDGVEAARTVNLEAGFCPDFVEDADPASQTQPGSRDSDGDGLADGLEDSNQNGRLDPGETDPGNADTDGDGLCDGPLSPGSCTAGEDLNSNGVVDFMETDPRVANGGADGGTADVNPNDPNNNSIDSDCDGLSDAEEFATVYGSGLRTNPANPDSDGDGIPDGVEVGRTVSVDPSCSAFVGDADPATRTDPTVADTDRDGLDDGAEDGDQDGAYQAGVELNPLDPDTDQDGLLDGVDPNPFAADSDSDGDGLADVVDSAPNDADRDGDGLCDGSRAVAGVCVSGEDLNNDGVVNAGETDPDSADSDCDGVGDQEELAEGLDPRRADSDGDLITDGVELGLTGNPAPGVCSAPPADADPSSVTKADNADSDGDGINDGIEDANQNGRVDSGETDPQNPDSDGDGLCDGVLTVAGLCVSGEDLNGNGVVDPGETDPRVAGTAATDSDGDGISDSVENSIACLDPNLADSDGDGLCDGAIAVGSCGVGEDLNSNGFVDSGETDPCEIDSDCDGLVDGDSFGDYLGEIAFGTQADNADSDGDGLTDGLEVGVAGSAIPPNSQASCGFVADADPASSTSPTQEDSDGDGVPDGAEDSNQNGRHDSGELDPEVQDATGPAVDACSTSSLVQVELSSAWQPDHLLATADYGGADAFSERTTLGASGAQVGLMFYNPSHHVAAFVLSVTPAAGDTTAAAAELARRPVIANLSAPFTRTITTWDGFAQSVLASYDDSSAAAVKTRTNAIVTALLGTAPTGLLSTGGAAGPHKLLMEYVRRSDQRLVIVGTLIPASRYTGAGQFRAEDVANGSALAQFGDGVGTQCDFFEPQEKAKVDFLWVIDNSGSMYDEQNTVADSATEMTNQLAASTLDWRLGVITTDLDFHSTHTWGTYVYQHSGTYVTSGWNCALGFPLGAERWPAYCGFSTDPAVFDGCVRSLYICGGAEESGFAPFVCVMGGSVGGLTYCGSTASGSWVYGPPPAAYRMLPAAASDVTKVRTGAQLVVVIVSDEPEQSDAANGVTTTVQQWVDFFSNYDGNGSSAFVAGILCPPGQNCACTGTGCTPSDDRYSNLIQAMGGVEGDISDYATIPGTITNIVNAVAGNASPYLLSKPPISSTIKVATDAATTGTCNASDIPRSRDHGWDYDGATGSIVFFGNCRPIRSTGNEQIAVSYRYWVDRTADPNGPQQGCDCTPPEVCDPQTLQCYCPPDCGLGNVPANQVCDTASCSLTCREDCGATCSGNAVCNSGNCLCECPQNCGGQPPTPEFVCDREPTSATYCSYTCPQCPGSPSNPAQLCNPQTCHWECPDCGACPGLATCSPQDCSCVCDQNISCGTGTVWNQEQCNCVCDVDALGCRSPYAVDEQLCACVCADNCGDICSGGYLCHSSLCECACPGDCGLANVPPERLCDTASCTLQCRPDCGQTCPGNTVCNPANDVCACECPQDCGGTPPAEGFVCDRESTSPTYCQYVCTACPGTAPHEDMVCDLSTCQWTCSDCGDCPGLSVCSATSCECECQETATCPSGFVWDQTRCECLCDVAGLNCGAEYVVDNTICACRCGDNCNDRCGQGTHCNLSYCECLPDDG